MIDEKTVSPEVERIIAYADEVSLAYWGETSSSGKKVKFVLPTNTKEHPFKKFTTREKNKGGQRFAGYFTPVTEVPKDGRTPINNHNPALRKKITVELILTHWGETASTGRNVTFLVGEDENCEHPFQLFDIGKGKKAGQQFNCVLVQIDDSEKPIEQDISFGSEVTRDRDYDIPETVEPEVKAKEQEKKEPKPFEEWQPSRQAGVLCKSIEFNTFLELEYSTYANHSIDTADTIRKIFRIATRKELNNEPLLGQWKELVKQYYNWRDKQEAWLYGG